MLSCGLASAAAFAILRRHHVECLPVPEAALLAAPATLARLGSLPSTPSGATGLAGLEAALADPALATRLSLGPESRVLLIISEGPA